jgi:hypothetical protein
LIFICFEQIGGGIIANLPLAARQKKGCVTVVTQPIFLI